MERWRGFGELLLRIEKFKVKSVGGLLGELLRRLLVFYLQYSHRTTTDADDEKLLLLH